MSSRLRTFLVAATAATAAVVVAVPAAPAPAAKRGQGKAAKPAVPAVPMPAVPAVPALPPPPPNNRPAPKPPPGAAVAAAKAGAAYEAIAPRAALVFDVATGEPLFQLNPEQQMPIASLTKMMTALLIAGKHRPDEQMLISPKAAATPGSRIGVLPKNKLVPLGPVFVGLLLVSGNDAATALAEHSAGSESSFVARMNRKAQALGMTCSHFTTPHGLQDEGNYSCAKDLATLAQADLSDPWIREVARMKKASYPFPIEGGKLEVVNNDYFIQRGLPQILGAKVTGLKTGYTDPAGRCYVVTAEAGGRELGVIVLHSPDPLTQVPLLLERAFAGR